MLRGYFANKGIGSVYKRHPVTKFEHGNHGASKRKSHDRILVSDAATRIYICKKNFAPLMLYAVSPFSLTYLLADTCELDAYMPVAATMLNGRIGAEL